VSLLDQEREKAAAAEPAEEKPPRESAATVMVRLVVASGAELFHDADKVPYLTIDAGGRRETYRLRSKAARQWMARLYYLDQKKVPGGQAVADAAAVLEGKSLHEGKELPVYVRLAAHEGAIYLDLGDCDWRAVQVDAKGWRLVPDAPVKFIRPRGLLALPRPVAGGRVEDLRQFINVAGDRDWIILVAWLLQAFRACGPYPVLCLHGEQGSAKSTAARLLRRLIDPNKADLRKQPREDRDLMVMAINAWVLAFDNLSTMPDWLSDALCCLATGGGFGTRELYSDAEETIFDATRPVILTGIEDLASRGDLIERSLLVRLPSLPKEKRRSERELSAQFDQARPKILGALLDAVSGALRRLDFVRLDVRPRMADFAEWVTAAEATLMWKAGAFLDAYQGNQEDANEVALTSSPLVVPVRQLAARAGGWKGTATELLKALTELVVETEARSREWPKRANTLSGRLRRLAPNLRAVGVHVTFDREGHACDRTITITQEGKGDSSSASSASPAGEPSGFSDNGCDHRRAGGAADDADDTRSVGHASPAPPSAGQPREDQRVRDADDDADGADDDLRPCSSGGWVDPDEVETLAHNPFEESER
jgi:hypothetical protein